MKITVVKGIEGPCLCVNNYRVAGPKPYGGGTVIAEFDITEDVLRQRVEEAIENGVS